MKTRLKTSVMTERPYERDSCRGLYSQAVTVALQTHQAQRKIVNIIHATDMLKALSSFIHMIRDSGF
jgi:23S rRNA A2030 N6-methylase RlmJ